MIRSQTSRKILVPCDGSKPSANALTKAVRVVHACRRWCKYRADRDYLALCQFRTLKSLRLFDENEIMVAESAQIKYIQQICTLI